MAAASKQKKVTLRSSDGEVFEVLEEAIGEQSGMIKGMLEEDCATDVIPLPNVKGPILSLVLEYVNKHFDAGSPQDSFLAPTNAADDPLKRFDDAFVQVDKGTLFDLIEAASYLDIQSLLDLTCKTVADMIKGRTTEQIREEFHIVNDYTEEEEEEVRRENSWAFEVLF